MESNAYRKKEFSIVGVALTGILIIVAFVMAWLYLRDSYKNPLSNDAVIGANYVNIAATVPGKIISINVTENQAVKKGDTLFSIDPEPLRLLVEQTTADLAIAEAALDSQRRAVAAESQNALIADEQVTRARTNLDLAEATLKRLEALSPKGYVTRQQVDDAKTLRNDAQISLNQAVKQAKTATTLVGTLDSAQALVRARQAALALAQHNLDNSVVKSPHDGRVVGLTNGTGQIVAPGQSLFTLIDTSSWYATATFPETELSGIKVGDCAQVRILANSSIVVKGRVEGIGWGVSSEDLINIPRNLPYVPKNLNWVRIAQRFPVRVKLINPPAELTRSGASAVVTVHDGDKC
ncbi:multidrug transporter subunit MdtN [Brucella gallinifaecis]|uniref:Multidrug transporter subunit MdtN n=1 Tax=Brucella gallinifaecis TaxID=215590 RepID=A0A502BL35_9HYPH|nr:multidrug transporter subunit MdtN [Brucella gallinifaecis]TPF74138.1 multidrug transporter subunit MdtN [Brucella gallinifaecis]